MIISHRTIVFRKNGFDTDCTISSSVIQFDIKSITLTSLKMLNVNDDNTVYITIDEIGMDVIDINGGSRGFTFIVPHNTPRGQYINFTGICSQFIHKSNESQQKRLNQSQMNIRICDSTFLPYQANVEWEMTLDIEYHLKWNVGDLIYVTNHPIIGHKYARIRSFINNTQGLRERFFVVVEGYYEQGELQIYEVNKDNVLVSKASDSMPNKDRMIPLLY